MRLMVACGISILKGVGDMVAAPVVPPGS